MVLNLIAYGRTARTMLGVQFPAKSGPTKQRSWSRLAWTGPALLQSVIPGGPAIGQEFEQEI